LDADLTPVELVRAESFRIFIEEWAHWLRLWDLWIVNYYRARSYIFSQGGLTFYPGQVIFGWMAYRKQKKNNYIQGFGRHLDEEISEFVKRAVEMMAIFVRDEPGCRIWRDHVLCKQPYLGFFCARIGSRMFPRSRLVRSQSILNWIIGRGKWLQSAFLSGTSRRGIYT